MRVDGVDGSADLALDVGVRDEVVRGNEILAHVGHAQQRVTMPSLSQSKKSHISASLPASYSAKVARLM